MKNSYKFVQLLCLLLFNAVTFAEQVSFEFSANVEQVLDPHDLLIEKINYGDEIRGIYTFNTNVLDTDSTLQYGYFNQLNAQGNGFKLFIKDLKINSTSNNENLFHFISTFNGESDYYFIENKGVIKIHNGLVIAHINLEIFDKTGTALSEARLTNNPPLIHNAEDKNILLGGYNEDTGEKFDIKATINHIARTHQTAELD